MTDVSNLCGRHLQSQSDMYPVSYRESSLARKLKRAEALAMQATHKVTHPSPRSHERHLSLVNTL